MAAPQPSSRSAAGPHATFEANPRLFKGRATTPKRGGPGESDTGLSDCLASSLGCGSGPQQEQEQGKKEAAQPRTGIQGASCLSSDQGRQDLGGTGPAARHPPQPDHRLEGATAGTRGPGI